MNKFYALKQNKYADEFMLSKKMAFFFITFLTISTFLTFIPNSAGELKISDSKIINGLYANYTFEYGPPQATSFKYVHDSGNIYNVTWWQNVSLPGLW
jgi:hypothetical protein